MTPQKRAIAILYTVKDIYDTSFDAEQLRYIENHLVSAIREEREACARLCDSSSLEEWVCESGDLAFTQRVTATVLASLIRSR